MIQWKIAIFFVGGFLTEYQLLAVNALRCAAINVITNSWMLGAALWWILSMFEYETYID
jgi:hypothetical protein